VNRHLNSNWLETESFSIETNLDKQHPLKVATIKGMEEIENLIPKIYSGHVCVRYFNAF
jgi:hypothetical protein